MPDSPVKLGKLPAKRSLKSLPLGNYLTPSKLAFPPVCAWERPIPYGMLLNNIIGDCAIAAPAHMEMNWQAVANAGTPLNISDAEVQKDYSAVSGYDPATGTNDNGCYMLDVLNYWRNTGIAGRKIAGFTTLDWQNIEQIKAAIYFFGGVYFGFNVPLFIMEQTEKIWRPQTQDANLIGGHAVCSVGYGRNGTALISWGDVYRMTWDFWIKYVDEAYAVVSSDWIKQSGIAPSGVALEALLADLSAIHQV